MFWISSLVRDIIDWFEYHTWYTLSTWLAQISCLLQIWYGCLCILINSLSEPYLIVISGTISMYLLTQRIGEWVFILLWFDDSCLYLFMLMYYDYLSYIFILGLACGPTSIVWFVFWYYTCFFFINIWHIQVVVPTI